MEDYVYMDARLIRKYLTGFPFDFITFIFYQGKSYLIILPYHNKKVLKNISGLLTIVLIYC